MGWILLIESGRWRVKETELTWAITSKGPRYFSASFLEGWVVQMLLDLTKTLSPIEVQQWSPMFVCGDRVSFLCIGYVGLELLVQVVKVNHKVSGPDGGDITFGVDGDARMITLVGVEQSQAHCSIQSIVISELCQW